MVKNPAQNIRVLLRGQVQFADRQEAAHLLAAELARCSLAQPVVVLGIPRGGVVIGGILADRLNAQLDILLSRKLGAPENSELAIGAICEDGTRILNPYLIEQLSVSERFIDEETRRQVCLLQVRRERFRPGHPKIPCAGKTVIVTDDGLATGATMEAGLGGVRKERVGRLIVAVPVAPEDALLRVARLADEVVCLASPAPFGAVGQFYRDFPQVDDREVARILSSGA